MVGWLVGYGFENVVWILKDVSSHCSLRVMISVFTVADSDLAGDTAFVRLGHAGFKMSTIHLSILWIYINRLDNHTIAATATTTTTTTTMSSNKTNAPTAIPVTIARPKPRNPSVGAKTVAKGLPMKPVVKQ